MPLKLRRIDRHVCGVAELYHRRLVTPGREQSAVLLVSMRHESKYECEGEGECRCEGLESVELVMHEAVYGAAIGGPPGRASGCAAQCC